MTRILLLLTIVCPLLCGAAFRYLPIEYPGATATFANGINNAGLVVGTYRDNGGLAHGFVLNDHTYTSFDFPGSQETYANGINDLGEIVGWNGAASYLYSGGTFTTFNFPGTIRTIAVGVNIHRDIVGSFIDFAGNSRGFLYTGGAFTAIDVSGAVSTGAYAINDNGTIVGQAPFVANGFVLTSGSVTPIPNFPGSIATLSATNINNHGHITGEYAYVGDGPFFANSGGYILRDGNFDSILVPGSPSARPNDLNDLDVIVGDFADASGTSYGFIATPVPEPSSSLLFASSVALLLIAVLRQRRYVSASA